MVDIRAKAVASSHGVAGGSWSKKCECPEIVMKFFFG
jgi:hypothetical protein